MAMSKILNGENVVVQAWIGYGFGDENLIPVRVERDYPTLRALGLLIAGGLSQKFDGEGDHLRGVIDDMGRVSSRECTYQLMLFYGQC